jgi:alkanesulfonate monooxygenase SsuD/methylene tetrahydromethanopterin reductase-like flavin-dependent oxidoreductase (luciferase family)
MAYANSNNHLIGEYVKFGTNIMTHRAFGDSSARVLKEWVHNAILAEQLGYHSAWCTEHHFQSDPNYRPLGLTEKQYPSADYDLAPDPLTLLTFAAAKTTKLHFGTAVSILHWDHPIRLVERAAMLDLLSDRRFYLGVGRGLGFREAEVFGVPADPKANERRYHEAVAIIRQAWTGERFKFDGEFYKVPPLAITPIPDRQPCPIVIGSASNNSAIWAAEQDLAYATITWPLVDFDVYKQKRQAYLEKGRSMGFDIERHLCPHFLYMYCGESDAEAADVIMHQMSQFQFINEHHYELAREHKENAAVLSGHNTNSGTAASARGIGKEQILERVRSLSQQVIDYHIVGSAKTCAERVLAYQQEANVNYIVMNMKIGMMPQAQHEASMRRFAKEVMPRMAD